MTQALSSNLGLHVPSPRGSSSSNFNSTQRFFNPVMAMAAGESRDRTQHLQRPTNKRRVSPPIGLWDRFPTMEGMMEDPFAFSIGDWPSSPVGERRGRTPWEIKEGEEEYKMRFDMPGMSKEDVRVWVEEEKKMLVVKAEKKIEEEEEWSANSYGRYNSRIALPQNVVIEKIKAEVKEGVLYITIPKNNILDIHVQ